MPKILLISHYFSTHRGGVEIIAGELAARLAARGFEIEWISSDCDALPLPQNNLRFIPLKTWNFFEKNFGIPWPIWHPQEFSKMIKSIKSSAAIHIHEYEYPGHFAAFLVALFFKKPVVLTQHIGFIPYDNRFLRNLLHWIHRSIGRLVMRYADSVVFISETVARYFSNYKYKAPPSFIPNGCDTDCFFSVKFEKRMQIRQENDLDTGRPLCLFVGRFVEKKGLRMIEYLARVYSHFQWILIGWGPVDPAKWNLKNVKVYYSMDQSVLVSFYQTADLLVLPSKGEGFPLVVQEAMVCGTPAFVGKETAEGISAARPLLFYEEVLGEFATEKWQKKLHEIFSNKLLLESRRSLVEAFARNQWSWNQCADQYQMIFEQLSNYGK